MGEKTMGEHDLSVQQVADIFGVHRLTIVRYEARGLIRAYRNHLNHRRFPQTEVEKLRAIFTLRCRDGEEASK